jgi:hypothetical protein
VTTHDPTHGLRLQAQAAAVDLVEQTRRALLHLLDLVEQHNDALRDQHPTTKARRGRLNLKDVLRPACKGLKTEVLNGFANLAYNTPRAENPNWTRKYKDPSAPRYAPVATRIIEQRGQVLQSTSDPRKFRIAAFLGRVEGRKQYTTRIVKGTQLDAEKALTELLKQARRGPILTAPRQTVAQYAREVFLPAKKRSVRSTTLENYEFSLEKHVLPRVGSRSLHSLDEYALNAFAQRMKADGVGDRTRGVALMTLKQVIGHSREQGDYRL